MKFITMIIRAFYDYNYCKNKFEQKKEKSTIPQFFLSSGLSKLKFTFSKTATKIDKIFTINLTLCSKCQMDGEDFIKFCGLLGKHKL